MKHYRHYRGRRPAKRIFPCLVALVLAGVLVFALLFGLVMLGSRDRLEGDPKLMIILGCQVKPWGPSILLQDRLNKALDYLEAHPNIIVVVSGGQGPDEPTTEAAAMRDYLTERGFPAEQILLEEHSVSTLQNLQYSLKVLEEAGYDTGEDMAVVSNGFHLTRVRMLWNRLTGGEGDLTTLAAPSSHRPSRLKMYVREPLALAKSYLFDR